MALVATVAAGRVALAAEPVTLQWLEWWDPEWGVDVMDGLTKKFEEKTGIKVQRTAVPGTACTTCWSRTLRAGKFDVLGMEGCCFLSGIDKLGGVEPLAPYLAADKDFAAGLTDLTPVKWHGEPMMLNWYIMPYSYVYNIDLFKKAGLAPPKNWNEVLDSAKKLNDSGIVAHGLGVTFGDSSILYPMYYLFGARWRSWAAACTTIAGTQRSIRPKASPPWSGGRSSTTAAFSRPVRSARRGASSARTSPPRRSPACGAGRSRGRSPSR